MTEPKPIDEGVLQERRRDALRDPRLAAFLPALYVAWADGDLDEEEVREICAAVGQAADLDAECSEVLGGWLDPADPPSALELRRLLTAVRLAARDLAPGERTSLTALGAALAERRGHRPSAAEREALMRLEKALEVGEAEAAARVLTVERPEAAEAAPERPFEPAAMAELLHGERLALRRRALEVISEPPFAYRYDVGMDERRERTLVLCRRLAAEGFGALGLPQPYGAGDPAGFIAVFEALAHGDLSLLVKFGVQFGLFAGSIRQLGTERHHREYLPAAGALELPGCFAMTETGHGSNVADLETVIRFDRERDGFVVDTPSRAAYKDYIGNAARDGRMATVFGQLEIDDERFGVHAILVPIRAEDGTLLPGVTAEDDGPKLGLNGVDNGRLAFAEVFVPRDNLLDRFASVDPAGVYSSPIASPGKRFFTMLGTLVGGRVSVALAGLSAAKSALAIAVRYAERRRQFGPQGEPEVLLLDYPSHQRRLLPRLARTYALHFALQHLARRYVAAEDDAQRREVEGLAAALKSAATWHATDVIQECREACGGQGYLAENRFAALKADTDVFTTFEGDNTVLLQLVAKGMLTRYKKQFGDMGFLDLVRYVADRAATTVRELNPIVTRATDSDHLRSAEFLSGAFEWRERHLLATVARRLKSRLDGGMEPTDAMMECQNHLLAGARAHAERVVFERAAEAIAGAPEALSPTLARLLALHGLGAVERDAGWFLEHGYLEGGKARSVRSEIDTLCAELRPAARALVDAFEIPDAVLAAPIAVG